MFAAYTRISSYETYTEKNSLGSVFVLLQYHPIDKKQIRNMKWKCMIRFLGKLGLLSLVIQLISAYIGYGTLSWINFVYSLVFAFLLPALFEAFFIWFRDRFLYGEL